MKDEKAEFSARLRDALKGVGITPSASVLERLFNSRYEGTSVTAQAASQWLNGKAIPRQDKMRVLANIVGLEVHALQYGGKRVSEVKAEWGPVMTAQDRAMVDSFLHLPTPQRKLVRELVAVLSAAAAAAAAAADKE